MGRRGSPPSSYIWERRDSSTMVWQPVLENSEFKQVKLSLKIDLVSHPARAEGLGKYMFVYMSVCLSS